MLGRNLFPPNVIENVVKFHNNNFPSDSFQSAAHKKNCLYFALRNLCLILPLCSGFLSLFHQVDTARERA